MIRYKSIIVFMLIAAVTVTSAYFISGYNVNNREVAQNSIEYVSMWNEEEIQAAYLKDIAYDFEKQTGIKVKLVFSDRDVLIKVKSRLMMGDPPDIIDQDFNELLYSMTAGILEAADLKDIFYEEKGPEGQNRFIDIFNEDYIKFYKHEGNIFMIPYEFMTSGFFYDRTLFAKYGLEPPEKWEDFIKNNEILKRNNIKPIALDGNINWYNAYYYYWAVERVMGPGALLEAVGDKSGETWNHPGYLKAAQMVYDLGKSGSGYFQDNYEKSEWPRAQVEWAEGKYGSLLCSTWIPNETQKYTRQDFKYGFYPFPVLEEGAGKITDVEVSFIGCAIPKDSKKIGYARTFLRFLLKKENAQKFTDMTKNISAREDVEYPKELASVKKYIKDGKRLVKVYDAIWADYPEWCSSVFFSLDNKLVYGKIKPEDFIKQIKENSKVFWNQRKQKRND